MTVRARQRLFLTLATVVFGLHLLLATVVKPSYALTVYGDANPCILLVLAILAARENFKQSSGVLPVFWRLFVAGSTVWLASQAYWFAYDVQKLNSTESPITGDTLFLLAHLFFLSALALRPHSAAAGRHLRIRLLDLILLGVWWLTLYGYFSLCWQFTHQNSAEYGPSFNLLALLQHLVLVVVLAALALRHAGPWRRFYLYFLSVFAVLAPANMVLNISIDLGEYYPGSFYDTPFLLAIYLLVAVVALAPELQPIPDTRPNRELIQSVWTARLAMLGILSLPLLALWGLFEKHLPPIVATFRLRLVFAAMSFLGVLLYCKFHLLARELRRLVQLTRDSIETLNTVQQQVYQSEKLVALGRLASGAAHEISNPLTAIFGYSELLADIPALTPDDLANAQFIQHQVHRAQAAVTSLRDSLRQKPQPNLVVVDKKPTI